MTALVSFVLSPIGRYLAGAAIIITALTGAYFYIKGVGYAQCKADWIAADRASIERGIGNRRDADRDVDSGRVRDRFDSDKH